MRRHHMDSHDSMQTNQYSRQSISEFPYQLKIDSYVLIARLFQVHATREDDVG